MANNAWGQRWRHLGAEIEITYPGEGGMLRVTVVEALARGAESAAPRSASIDIPIREWMGLADRVFHWLR